jgi:hypothetical protein
MAYPPSSECSLSILWDSVNCARPPFYPILAEKNAFISTPAMDIYTAANIGDYDVIYHVMNR